MKLDTRIPETLQVCSHAYMQYCNQAVPYIFDFFLINHKICFLSRGKMASGETIASRALSRWNSEIPRELIVMLWERTTVRFTLRNLVIAFLIIHNPSTLSLKRQAHFGVRINTTKGNNKFAKNLVNIHSIITSVHTVKWSLYILRSSHYTNSAW